MEALPTRLEGPILLQPTVHRDERGFFIETYRQEVLAELGVEDAWVAGQPLALEQRDRAGHALPARHGQAGPLLSRRDRRRRSSTFGRDRRPSASGRRSPSTTRTCVSFYCPDGFAHGFCVTSDVADVIYKCSAYYDPAAESGLRLRRSRRRHRMARPRPHAVRAGRKCALARGSRERASLRLREISLGARGPQRASPPRHCCTAGTRRRLVREAPQARSLGGAGRGRIRRLRRPCPSAKRRRESSLCTAPRTDQLPRADHRRHAGSQPDAGDEDGDQDDLIGKCDNARCRSRRRSAPRRCS